MVRVFRHYVPKSFLILALVEGLIFVVCFYGGVALRFAGELEPAEASAPVISKALLFMLVMSLSMVSMGLYHRSFREGIWETLGRIFSSFLTGILILTFLLYVFPLLFFGRGVLALVSLLAFCGIVASRVLFTHFIVDQDRVKRKIMVIGAGKRAASLKRYLRRKSDLRGVEIVGYIQLPHEESLVEGNVMPHNKVLLEFARKYDIVEFIVALDDRRKNFPINEIVDCRMAGINVVELLEFYERQAGKIVLEFLDPSYLIYSDGFKYGAVRVFLKRFSDLAASSLLLSVTWPVMLATALAIWMESRGKGPILYRQVRVGKNWKLFQVLKFRSMRVDAESEGEPRWAEHQDARITRVGSVIRKFRIDELPQIFNVLRGDMSFVGPRPERPEFVERLSKKIPYYSERHRVKPGLTGWAQICYPYGASDKDAAEKLQYDLYYVKNYSLFLDLVILLQTGQAVVWAKGAR